MHVHRPNRFRWSLLPCITAVALAALWLAPPAAADPHIELQAALAATEQAAGTGVGVVQNVTFGRSEDLGKAFVPRVAATVPAGGRVRVHFATNPGGTYYQSVRQMPGGALLGAAGVAAPAAGGRWATLSMLGDRSSAFAKGRGLSQAITVTNMDSGRMGPGDAAAMDPADAAMRLLVPPYANRSAEFWTGVKVTPANGGGTLLTAVSARGDAQVGDSCTYAGIRVSIGSDDRITSARWTETCPRSGAHRFASTATFGRQVVKPPARPRIGMNQALGLRVAGAAAGWADLTRAANRTMARADQRLQVADTVEWLEDPGTFTSTVDVDAGQVDAQNGQPAFSMVDGRPVQGWNPTDGWWLCPQSSTDVTDAMEAAGLSGARCVSQAPWPFFDLYSNDVAPDQFGLNVDRFGATKAFALNTLDFINMAGQPGRVHKVAGPAGATIYTIKPTGSGTFLADYGDVWRIMSARVVVNVTGEVESTTMALDDSRIDDNAGRFDGAVDLEQTMDILRGQGTVIGASAGQTVTHSQIAPYLPAFPQRL
ncbi:MAG: hypothetical protein IPO93_10805 [Actinobacteria bacterium]|nr:hypothetical protein [Actinomycetota bacterium]